MILRERQRIMEDVHDGFGGRLLSMLLKAEEGDLNNETLKAGLRGSLQDLRLIVDSMDTADGELSLALGALRGRIESELSTAKIGLDWRVDLGEYDLRIGSKETLSIFRMVQETVTNAIHHSNATLVRVGIQRDDSHQLSLLISDDGVGTNAHFCPGRGLKNIKSRARELGGEARFCGASGFKVSIEIPIVAEGDGLS